MLCTNCSTEVKPVVALDIDGTLGDYHGHFLLFARAYLNEPVPRTDGYDGSTNFGDWICEHLGTDRRTYRDIKLAYRQGAQKRMMPVYLGAPGLTRRVKQAGAELWLTTSRPYRRLDNIDPDTLAWLERHDIEFDYLLYDEHKYGELAKRVEPERVVAVLDDLPEMLHDAEREFGAHVPIKRGTRWNRDSHYVGRCHHSLEGARTEIINRIEGWKWKENAE